MCVENWNLPSNFHPPAQSAGGERWCVCLYFYTHVAPSELEPVNS